MGPLDGSVTTIARIVARDGRGEIFDAVARWEAGLFHGEEVTVDDRAAMRERREREWATRLEGDTVEQEFREIDPAAALRYLPDRV